MRAAGASAHPSGCTVAAAAVLLDDCIAALHTTLTRGKILPPPLGTTVPSRLHAIIACDYYTWPASPRPRGMEMSELPS